MMSTILRDEASIAPMVSTTCATTAPPLARDVGGARRPAGWPARALSAFWRTVAGQLFHRGRGFFQRAGLLLGARGQVQVAGGDLARGGGDGRRLPLRTSRRPARSGWRSCPAGAASAGRSRRCRATSMSAGQVALGHGARHLDRAAQRPHDRTGDHAGRRRSPAAWRTAATMAMMRSAVV